MQHDNHSSYSLHLNDLLGLLPWFPAGLVCDIGSGEGHLSAAVAAYGFVVEALDVDPHCIQSAGQCYGDQVSWIHHDIRGYRLQREAYASIFCLNVFPFIPNGERARIIGRLKAAVKPGGFLIVSGLNESDSAASEKWARSSNQIGSMPTGTFQRNELKERLQDWEILFSFTGMAEAKFGSEEGQHQMSQIIARKPISVVKTDWKSLPQLGLGLDACQGLPKPLVLQDKFDFIEINADDYLEPEQDAALNRLCRDFTVLPHARALSLGSLELRQDGYIEALARVVGRCGVPWWSEYLAYSRSELQESLGLQPLPTTEEALEIVKRNIRRVRKQIVVPLLLENIVYRQPFFAVDMDDATFLRHVALESDCGVVLNLTHLYHNACSLGLDPEEYIRRLPAERVLQLRISASQHLDKIWTLAAFALKHCDIRAVSLDTQAATDLPESVLQSFQGLGKAVGMSV